MAHATFGVAVRNGTYVPWMQGEIPTTMTLYSNSAVQRTLDQYGYWEERWSNLRWRGSLVGFTPAGDRVTGSASLSDFFYHYSGSGYDGTERPPAGWEAGTGYLELTNLVHDSGATWGDGDLRYEVALGLTLKHGAGPLEQSFSHPFRRFNCSRSPSGCHNDSIIKAAGVRDEGYSTTDAGEVRGMFFGPEHEAFAGTLERDDLTAAFGGTR